MFIHKNRPKSLWDYINISSILGLIFVASIVLLGVAMGYVWFVEIPANNDYKTKCAQSGGVVLSAENTTVCIDKNALKQQIEE